MSYDRLLPRSVLLSLWIEHLEVGAASIKDATDAVQGYDEPHSVVWPDGQVAPLSELLSVWTASTRDVAAVLPVAGDLSGLSGPGSVNTAAVDAGEVVLFSNVSGHFAAVPHVTEFGSHIEPGHMVTWEIFEANAWRQRFLGTLGYWIDARRNLDMGVEQTIDRLMILDVSPWRDDVAVEIEALRDSAYVPDPMPETLNPLRAELLASGWRLATIVDLAQADDGGAISGWEADRRREALTAMESNARRAVSAATLGTPSSTI